MLKACMIDQREPAWIQNLKFGGIPTVATQLDYGDLWVSCSDGSMLVIERKTPSDLLGSIKDNRLFQQVAGIRAKTPWAYLVITGILTANHAGKVIVDSRVTGWDYSAVQGALLSVQELGVAVVHSQDDSGYEETVIRLAKRDRNTERPIESRVHAHVMSPGEQILCSLPGIGWERAQALLGTFDGRAGEALAWLTWENTVHDVEGIGKGTKSAVRKALGLTQEEELSVLTSAGYEYYLQNMKEEKVKI